MARGKSIFGNKQFFYLNIKGLKPNESVHFTQTTKEGDDYKELENVQNVSGKLTDIKVEEKEWEGDKYKVFKLLLEDAVEGEVCIIECGMNNMGRGILNTLAGIADAVDQFGEVYVAVYNKKKTGFASAYITNDDATYDWKWDFQKDLASMVIENKVRKNGKDVIEKDYFDLNNFLLENAVPLIKSKVASPSAGSTPEPKDEMISNEPETIGGEEEGDDLPF